MAFKMNDEGGENFKLQLVFGGHYHQTLRACLAGRQAILRPVGRLGSSVREFPEHVFSSSLKFGIIEFDNVRISWEGHKIWENLPTLQVLVANLFVFLNMLQDDFLSHIQSVEKPDIFEKKSMKIEANYYFNIEVVDGF